MVWSDQQIENAARTVEEDFSREYPCIEERYALPVINGISTYLMPSQLMTIRRITWNGWRVNPLPQREYRTVFQGAQTQTGRPFWYVYSDLVEQKKIRLYPTPNFTITASGNLYGSGIAQGCVISYWRTPDETHTIPRWLRRRVLKAGSLALLFTQEGKGQDLTAAKFWDAFFVALANRMGGLINTSARKLIMQDSMAWQGRYPAGPVLPIDRFGVGVSEYGDF